MTPELSVEQLHARLATVVGAEQVGALPADPGYGALLGPHLERAALPLAVVRPASTEQIQRLAPMLAELGYGLWSSPNGSGNGAQAGHPGKRGVLLDLSRMKRILEVDRHGAFALIEAGVSFDELAAHLHERDLPLWLDADANGAHAVAGSIAERQSGLTPYGDHQAALCGVEAVLATGAVVRTGMGALPGSACWPRYKANFGPALDGLFSRAHFGVVTQLGLWLMPAPRRFLPFSLALPDLATVASLVERLRPLLLDGTLTGRVLFASRASDAALLARKDGGAARDGGAPPWTLYGALYGLPDIVALHRDTLAKALGAEPGAGQGAAWPLRLRQLRGESLYSESRGVAAGSLSFCLLAPAAGADVQALHHGVLKRLADFEPRLEFQLGPRLLALNVTLPASADIDAKGLAACLAACKDLVKAGYGLRHGSPALDATLAARHTPAGLRHLYDGLHSALDPFAVLAKRGVFAAGSKR